MALLPDPDEHLTHMREQLILHIEAQQDGAHTARRNAAARMVRLFAELDAHMTAGGPPPAPWTQAAPAHPDGGTR